MMHNVRRAPTTPFLVGKSNLTKNIGLRKSIARKQEMVNKMTKKSNQDNRSRQKNPNNDQYYKDRGYQGGKSEYKKKYGM